MYRSLPLLALTLAGCATPSGHDTGACSTGSYWEGGNEESPDMNPGASCVACHATGEGPNYAIAGTVMGDYADPDDCNGIAGVIVRLTDADGGVHELTTNDAGNFYKKDGIPLPYTAEIESADGVREMAAAQTDGDCAACHTAEGAGGAPGRILAPG